MRMAGPDIVLFVIGALLFGGATYAIVSSPEGAGDASSPVGAFNVAYELAVVEVDTQQVGSMRSGEVTFDVDLRDVSTVLITIACADPAAVTPVPFQVQASFTGPNGARGEGDGACGSPIVFEFNTGYEIPEPGVVAGSTESEARENLEREGDNRTVGAWTVTVSGSRGATPGLPVGDPSGTITLEAEVAQARLTPVQR